MVPYWSPVSRHQTVCIWFEWTSSCCFHLASVFRNFFTLNVRNCCRQMYHFVQSLSNSQEYSEGCHNSQWRCVLHEGFRRIISIKNVVQQHCSRPVSFVRIAGTNHSECVPRLKLMIIVKWKSFNKLAKWNSISLLNDMFWDLSNHSTSSVAFNCHCWCS